MTKQIRAIATALLLIVLVASVATAQSGARGAPRVVQYTLRVLSNAPDSRVFINAVAQPGTTPLDVQLNAGEYEVVVRAPGYLDYATKVNLSRDLTINARLQPATYQLTVSSNAPGAAVYINGSNRGTAPTTLTLQMAEYTLMVRAPGYEDFTTTVVLNRNMNVSASQKAVMYMVTVNSNVKGATVYVDGNARGNAPVDIPLMVGSYAISVIADGYLEYNTRINVQRDTNVNANLQPAFSQVVLSIPQALLNPMVKDPITLVQIYIDQQAITDQEMRQMRFQIRPGRHTIWVVTGGLRLESSFVINPGKNYLLQLGIDLQLIDQSGGR